MEDVCSDVSGESEVCIGEAVCDSDDDYDEDMSPLTHQDEEGVRLNVFCCKKLTRPPRKSVV